MGVRVVDLFLRTRLFGEYAEATCRSWARPCLPGIALSLHLPRSFMPFTPTWLFLRFDGDRPSLRSAAFHTGPPVTFCCWEVLWRPTTNHQPPKHQCPPASPPPLLLIPPVVLLPFSPLFIWIVLPIIFATVLSSCIGSVNQLEVSGLLH